MILFVLERNGDYYAGRSDPEWCAGNRVVTSIDDAFVFRAELQKEQLVILDNPRMPHGDDNWSARAVQVTLR